MERRDCRCGCSADWPARKFVADWVRRRIMERLGCEERADSMLGIFIVATEPEAARRRCFLPSAAWADARKGVGCGAPLLLEDISNSPL